MDDFIQSKYFKAFLITIVAVQLFFIVFHPHLTYKYPLHGDEWHHISVARRLVTEGKYFHKLELGFDMFLVFLIKLGFDLILVYKYLPAVFACISSLALFFLMYDRTKDFYLSVLSMLFFMILPTNINILGIKFFTPLTMAIPFIYLFVLLFVKGFEKEDLKLVCLSFFILLILFFIHPVSATFMAPIILIYALFHRDFIKKNKLKLSAIIFCSLALILAYILILKISLYDVLILAKRNILFYKGWTPTEIEYSITELYKLLPLLFAALGFFLTLKKKELRIFTIWSSIPFVSLIVFTFFGISILAPYQRMLYYFMLSAAPLSAIGLHKALSHLGKFSPKNVTPVLIFFLLVVFFFYHIKIVNSEGEQFYHAINDYAYDAIKFLEPLEKGMVVAPKNNLSIATYAISGKSPLATEYFDGNETQKADLDRFFGADCSVKTEIIKRYKAIRYVIDWENCGWEKIYDQGFVIFRTNYKKERIKKNNNTLTKG